MEKLHFKNDYFYFLFRLVVGLLFFLHGAQKFGLIGEGNIAGFASAFGFSTGLASFVGLVELLGGLFILLGLWTRLSSALLSVVMLVAMILAHFPKGLNPLANGGELALLFFVGLLVLWDRGAGKWSLEKTLTGKEYF